MSAGPDLKLFMAVLDLGWLWWNQMRDADHRDWLMKCPSKASMTT